MMILNQKVLALTILIGVLLVLLGYAFELDLTMSLRHSARLLDVHSSIDAQSVAKTANHFYSCRGVRFLIKVMDATNGAYGDVAAANLFEKVRELGISDDEVVDKLLESGILTENLSVAITAASRYNAIQEYEDAIESHYAESYWQQWFEKNKWILGSEYLNILPERDIDVNDIADYLIRSIDGFLDVVEIKKPDVPFWTRPDSHGNLCPSAQLTAAIMQCLNYLYRIELQSNSVDFVERVNGTKTVKPQCMLVYGRSNSWGEDELKSLRILNASYHQLHIITYDQLLTRAKQLLGVEEAEEPEDDELPF